VPGPSITLTLDCKGLACPLPVLKLSTALKSLAAGAVVEMLSTDPGAVPDVEAYEKRTGHRLLEWSEAGGVYRFLVQRAR
jgi:tRNA 2-thiouridine synthesizing protein A